MASPAPATPAFKMPQFDSAEDKAKTEAELTAYLATISNGTKGRVRSTVCGEGYDSMTHWTSGSGVPGDGIGLHFAGFEGSVSSGPGKSMGFVSDGSSNGTQLTSTVQKEYGKGGFIHIGVVIARTGKEAKDVVGGPSVTGQVGYVGGSANDSGFSIGVSYPPGLAGGASNTNVLP